MEIKKGDIILIEKGTAWAVVGPMIKLFTWRYWEKGEKFPTKIHAETGLGMKDEFRYEALSAQPPVVQKVTRDLREVEVEVWRLKNYKRWAWDSIMKTACEEQEGKLYDMPTFMMFGLDWVFHTILFSKMMKGNLFEFCAESVARIYQDLVKTPCSPKPPQSTSPDLIGDFCRQSECSLSLPLNSQFMEVK